MKARKTIAFVFAPLGFDWKMSVATLSGLATKEVIVSTLGVLYSLGDEVTEEDSSLREVIASNIGFCICYGIYRLCDDLSAMPCRNRCLFKEAQSLKYTAYLVIFTFVTAWVLAFITYRVALMFT